MWYYISVHVLAPVIRFSPRVATIECDRLHIRDAYVNKSLKLLHNHSSFFSCRAFFCIPAIAAAAAIVVVLSHFSFTRSMGRFENNRAHNKWVFIQMSCLTISFIFLLMVIYVILHSVAPNSKVNTQPTDRHREWIDTQQKAYLEIYCRNEWQRDSERATRDNREKNTEKQTWGCKHCNTRQPKSNVIRCNEWKKNENK